MASIVFLALCVTVVVQNKCNKIHNEYFELLEEAFETRYELAFCYLLDFCTALEKQFSN